MPETTAPPSKFLYGHLWDFRYNRIQFLESLPQYGDITPLRFGLQRVFVIHHPKHIQKILIEQPERFQKLRLTRNLLRKGNNSDAILRKTQAWQKRRQIIQGKLHTQHVRDYAEMIRDTVREYLQIWTVGENIDIYRQLKQVTLHIASLILFGTDLKEDEHKVLDAVETLQIVASQRFDTLLPPAPLWTNFPNPRRIKHSIAALDKIVAKHINGEKLLTGYGNTLLATLVESRNSEGVISTASIREEMMSLLMSAHETVATTLSWTYYLLAQSPNATARLENEILTQIGDRPLELDDLPQVPYVKAIIQESMRLYPPAWTISRQAIETTTLANIEVPIGSRIFINPITLHRDERWFPDPHKFNPDRFIGGDIKKHSYLPFSTGSRKCIGRELAMLEAQILLISIVQHLYFHRNDTRQIEREALITLRPKQPVMLTFEKRN